MILTKFSYSVDSYQDSGAKITLTRTEDLATKIFTISSSNSLDMVKSFMNSVTDQLAQDYFPKVKK